MRKQVHTHNPELCIPSSQNLQISLVYTRFNAFPIADGAERFQPDKVGRNRFGEMKIGINYLNEEINRCPNPKLIQTTRHEQSTPQYEISSQSAITRWRESEENASI